MPLTPIDLAIAAAIAFVLGSVVTLCVMAALEPKVRT